MDVNEETFPFLIFHTVRSLMKKMNHLLLEHDIQITSDQMALLGLVNKANDEVSQQDLASILNKDKSAILRGVDILERKGYIRRESKPNDRRINLLVLTTEGKEILGKALEVEKVFIERVNGKISVEDYEIFRKVLNQIKQETIN